MCTNEIESSEALQENAIVEMLDNVMSSIAGEIVEVSIHCET